MSSAVGLNILPAPISTTTTVVSSPLPTQNDEVEKTNLEHNDLNHEDEQKVSKCIQMENNKEESDSNHNSEQNEESDFISDNDAENKSWKTVKEPPVVVPVICGNSMEANESNAVEVSISQNNDHSHGKIDNCEKGDAKTLNADEIEEEDDDEDMDKSINQDNDENEDDDEDDIEISVNDKHNATANSDLPKSKIINLSGGNIVGQSNVTVSSKSNRRKNKRKNFKPRNILYGDNDEEMEEQKNEKGDNTIDNPDQGPLNLSGHNGSASNTRMLLPRKMLEQQLLANQRSESEHGSSPNIASSPMDLSNYQSSDIEKHRNLSGSNEDRNSNVDEGDDDDLGSGENKGGHRPKFLDEENSDECGEDDNKIGAAAAAKGLSVVRPEVLFGENNSSSGCGSPTSSPGLSVPPTSHSSPFGGGAFPPGLMPFLGFPGTASRSTPAAGLASSDAMKDAFQEVLKLYGVPSELAEAIAKNAQNTQAKLPTPNFITDGLNNSAMGMLGARYPPTSGAPASPPSSNITPPGVGSATKPGLSESPFGQAGMLSAALMGNAHPGSILSGFPSTTISSGGNISQQPPTPPRTPKTPIGGASCSSPRFGLPPDHLRMPGGNSLGAPPSYIPTSVGNGMGNGMPPLLSLAAIQEQVGKGAPNILAAQLSKPPSMMLAGMPHLGPGGMSGLPPLPPPHILAAQRAASLAAATGGLMPKASTTDYTRYFKRFGSSLECGSFYCKDMNYREHFHCTVPMCKDKVFAKKEEMIRHSKWHQKMDEAFKYGFRRVTPMDDCSEQFPGCQHNKKQTHYHCIHTDTCDKVYISTSDVQMHFNYHRKDNAIQREGFQRFRGQEDCNSVHCPFHGQKTTHFHCNRSGCQFTFKNKADMEKHKNFHMKDEQLNKDGFKKFMKNDPCGFSTCRFSKTVNHIHCIRNNCDYVLHSSGQLYSHKRKHERRDNELAYRKYKLAQSVMEAMKGTGGEMPAGEEMAKLTASAGLDENGDLLEDGSFGGPGPESSNDGDGGSIAGGSDCGSTSPVPPPRSPVGPSSLGLLPKVEGTSMLPSHGSSGIPPLSGPLGSLSGLLAGGRSNIYSQHTSQASHAAYLAGGQPIPPSSPIFGGLSPIVHGAHGQSIPSPIHMPSISPHPGQAQPLLLSDLVRERVPEDAWQSYMLHFDNSEGCGFQGCDIEDLQHYHCKDEGCETVFRNEDGVREHGRNHFIQDQITDIAFLRGDPEESDPILVDCPESCPVKSALLKNSRSDTPTTPPSGSHFHCKWESCQEIIYSNEAPFKRLDHYKLHEYRKKMDMASGNFSLGAFSMGHPISSSTTNAMNVISTASSPANKDTMTMTLSTSLDAMFKRKRGRPPKNRVVEVWNENYSGSNSGGSHGNHCDNFSPQAVFTSFKLPKPGQNNAVTNLGSTTSLQLHEQPLLPTRFSSPTHGSFGTSGILSGNSENHGGKIFSAPLGGLPAMASQIEEAAEEKSSTSINGITQEKEDSNQDSDDENLQSESPDDAIEGNNNIEHKSNSNAINMKLASTQRKDESANSSLETSPSGAKAIKARGTYYPLTAFPTSMPQGPVMRKGDESPPRHETVPADETSPTISLKSKLGVNFMVSFGRKGEEASENPLAKLLQATQDVIDKESHTDTSTTPETNTNKISEDSEQSSITRSKKHLASSLASVNSINAIPSPYPPPPVAFMSGPLVAQAAMLSAHPLYGPEPEEESCGRPFCKLKRRPHYHCNLCNQGFTEKDKLETHLKRHTEPPQNAVSGAISSTPSLASLLAAAKESGCSSAIPNNLLNSVESSNSVSNLLASTEQALKQQQAILAAATASERRRNSSPNRGGGSPLTSSIANLSVISQQRPLSPSSRSGHSISPSPSLGGNSVSGSNNGTLSTPTSAASAPVSSSISLGKPSDSPRPSSAGSGSSSIFPTSSSLSISNSAAVAAAASLFPSLGVAFSAASPFNLGHPIFTSAGGLNMSGVAANGTNAAARMLLPPGLNPFFPPGFLQLPGIPGHNPFQPMLPGSPVDISRLPTSTGTLGNGMVFDPLKHPLTRVPGDPSLGGSLKRSATSPMSQILLDDESTMTPEEKKFKLQSSMRMLKDEPVPEGYMRFRFNEDCGFTCCNYREHQTHFHCMRKDCNYRFCDKTRFVQHTARHERLDTLCGKEFEGFRGVSCGRESCELNVDLQKAQPAPGDPQKSSSHFHCLKCDYYCTDTNKVVAHRRQHQKLDSIMAAGFEKYTPTQYCNIEGCQHNGKQTHYHCGKCQYSVLGLSQMEAHKYRHMNE